MKTLAILAALLPALAGACDVTFGGWSNHFMEPSDEHGSWVETHRSLGFECDGYGVARFDNSLGRPSYGVSKTWYFHRGSRTEWGAYAGLWSGYSDVVGGSGVVPVFSPTVNVKLYGPLWVDFFIMPPVQVMRLRWRFE